MTYWNDARLLAPAARRSRPRQDWAFNIGAAILIALMAVVFALTPSPIAHPATDDIVQASSGD